MPTTVCACGNRLKRADRYCSSCGTARSLAALKAPSVGSKVPKRRVAASSVDHARHALPERKHATVMFADICGSTEQIGTPDPEEAREYLDPALALMSGHVKAYGGIISQLLGDGILALFGAPLTQEDHALRACLAGLAIQRAVIDWNRERADTDKPIAVRVGIASGELVVSSASEYLSSHYRADGLTAHLAKRIEGLATAGSVVISASTFRLVDRHIEAKRLGTRAIAGFESPIELYELLLKEQRPRAASLARHGALAPLIDRVEVLSALNIVGSQALTSSMRAIGLTGEAGIGKSRVITEFCRAMRESGFSTCFVAAHAYGTHVQYAVIADLMRELMQPPPDAAARGAAVDFSSMDTWGPAAQAHHDAVVDLLDLGNPTAAWTDLTPSQRRRRIGDAVQWLITKRTESGPLMLVIEDLALADRESQRLLDQLLRRVEHLPLLVCVTYRHQFQPRWVDAPWFTEHVMRALEPQDMQSLAHAILGDDDSVQPLVTDLADRAQGNPFYLEQMTLTLVDDGTLVGAPGAYRCVQPEPALRVPGSIAAVIGARVDRLPTAAKTALEAAAIIGEPFTSELLASMQQVPTGEAESHLSHAVVAGLLSARVTEGETRYGFPHALVQEVVAATLTHARRRMLHRAVFNALRKQAGERSSDRDSVLAHHAYAGEAWSEAAEFALRSMSRSIRRSANRDALVMFDMGRDAARRLADGAVRATLELGLRLEAIGALLPLGRVDDIVDNLERAQTITQTIGDKKREAAVSLQLAVMLWTRGTYRQGLEIARHAAESATAVQSRSLQMAAMQARMMLNHGLGHYQEALDEARTVDRLFTAELAARRIMPGWAVIAAVNVKVFMADILARMAQFDAAQALCSEAYRDLTDHDHAFSRVMVDFVQAEIWVALDRAPEAAERLREALKSCLTNDVPTMYPAIVAALGGAMARGGEPAAAVELLEKAIAEKAYLAGGRYNEYYLSVNLGIALLQCGRHDDARATLTAAQAYARLYEQHAHEAEAAYWLAETEMAADRRSAAISSFEKARALADACSMSHLANVSRDRLETLTAAVATVNPA